MGKNAAGIVFVTEAIGTLDELAPLFVHKKEGLVAIAVIDVWNDHRTADISAEDVQAKLRAGYVLLLKKVIAGVESIVAVEFPHATVELCVLPT